MKREEIQSFENLKTFISQEKTGSVCHYTSYESLVMILKNRSFRLSRFDLMNDYSLKQTKALNEIGVRQKNNTQFFEFSV